LHEFFQSFVQATAPFEDDSRITFSGMATPSEARKGALSLSLSSSDGTGETGPRSEIGLVP
jgi:hypothetical protein